MKVYCIRHGETSYNLLGLCNDDPTRNVRLTTTGRQQAEAAAERLRTVPLERIYVSPLPRTRETAEIVNRHHQVPIETHPALGDIVSGFDGRPVADYFAAIAHDCLNAKAPGGESLMEHKDRVLDFLAWLSEQPYGNVLVVAHEETLRVFAAISRGLGDEALGTLSFANCEVFDFVLAPSSQRGGVAAFQTGA